MSGETETKNPGWAGETGEFGHLSEADVRGDAYVGARSPDGGHAGAACSMPYMRVQRDPEAPLFTGEYAERLEKILSRYPTKQAALLPVLNMVQEIRGHLSPEAMTTVAGALELSPAYVRGVATFYTMYNKRPVGRHLIQVCTNVGCNLCGADDVMEAFLEHTGTAPGQASDDGEFTVVEVECLGACGFPTVVQINDRYFENVEAGDVPAILERLRAESAGAVASTGDAASDDAADGGGEPAASGSATADAAEAASTGTGATNAVSAEDAAPSAGPTAPGSGAADPADAAPSDAPSDADTRPSRDGGAGRGEEES